MKSHTSINRHIYFDFQSIRHGCPYHCAQEEHYNILKCHISYYVHLPRSKSSRKACSAFRRGALNYSKSIMDINQKVDFYKAGNTFFFVFYYFVKIFRHSKKLNYTGKHTQILQLTFCYLGNDFNYNSGQIYTPRIRGSIFVYVQS